jgi:hypothetical protein
MRFTSMIAGRNVCCTLAADAPRSAVHHTPLTGTALEALMFEHRRWSGDDTRGT